MPRATTWVRASPAALRLDTPEPGAKLLRITLVRELTELAGIPILKCTTSPRGPAPDPLMSFDDYIFAPTGFLRGAAQALDLSGSLALRGFHTSDTPAEADARALASDARAVIAPLVAAVAAEVNGKPHP